MKKLFFTFALAIGMIALANAQLTVYIANNLANDVACKVVDNSGSGTPIAYYNQIAPGQITMDVANTWSWGLMCGVADLSNSNCSSNGLSNIINGAGSGSFSLAPCGSSADWFCTDLGGGVFVLKIVFQ